MKYILTALISIISLIVSGQIRNCTEFRDPPPIDTIRLALKSIRVSEYVDKPIDSLLNRLPRGFTIHKFIPLVKRINKPYYKTNELYIRYANGDYVSIQVKTFRFMNPIDPNKVWDITLFGKESFYLVTIDCSDGYHVSQDGNY